MTMDSGRQDEKSLPQLITQLADQVGDLISTEISLAKAEITAEIRKSGRAGGMLGGAAVLGNLAVLLFGLAAAWGLAAILDIAVGWGLLIVATVVAVSAGGLFAAGRNTLKEVDPVPERAIETLKEVPSWTREQKN